jgi:RNA polymerase sigma-70 factor (ECF subfamily)
MKAVAVAMLGPGQDAEDVVQDAALIALTRLGSVREPDAVSRWLAATVRNLSRQCLARRTRITPMGQVADSLLAPAADPCASLDARATTDWVWHAVNGLSEPLRHAVVLRYFTRASSYDAIAGVLGVPVGTVRSRLSQSRRLLKKALCELAMTAHPGHAHLVAERTALFAGIYSQYNEGGRCSLFRSALTAEAELRQVGTRVIERGRDRIGDWLEGDIELGVRFQLHDVIAGESVTVVEGAFLNPPDFPDHCPAVTTHVYLHDGAGIAQVRLHYAGGLRTEELALAAEG